MFNKYNLKTHSNISIELQEARLQLSESKNLETLIIKEKFI